MPRVNRDLQRRLAARRERERRRPAERRYNFQPRQPVDTVDADTDDGVVDGAAPAAAAEAPVSASGRRGGRQTQTPRAAPRPFGDYSVEYAYVAADLRRLGWVVGVVLIVLVGLYLVLPH